MASHLFKPDKHLPLIAIIRGVTPETVLEVAGILVEKGFSLIEVPLNSPDALISIKKLVDHYRTDLGKKLYIGAGTVTSLSQAEAVLATGANLVVTPNLNLDVLALTRQRDCICFPGVVTPSEAFSAVSAGATGIKLFPISMIGLDGFKALKSVLPENVLTYPVGGIDPSVESMLPYLELGASGFGLGSALFKPSMTMADISNAAESFVHSFSQCVEQLK
ncbi:2-dehydro-3-deoxy-6-phosphogalactonate aldolase [Gayadomonas joobiniege]|uniref:2-dehydro-3-deoxy-6-phosphogalactonate aldolase n=1 Tax=Gayadomonas joobiniege TaxID=1234606 RepID=UPI000365AD7D|nr:2-dehydro-3-deoxy-6-phosphogalactonate aldolase [Gayadomonas joobiniege]